MTKPKLISFEKGKTPYTVEGFVEFMNWMCAAFRNLRGNGDGNSGGGGIHLKWTDPTHPVISGGDQVRLSEGSGISIDKSGNTYIISAHYV